MRLPFITIRRLIFGAFIVVATIAAIRATREPSTNRDWTPEQKRLPRIVIEGDIVEIRDMRDFAWRGENDFTPRYVTRRFDLRQLDSVDYVISRFGGIPGMAHAFLTFGFTGGEYVSVSVEARKEHDETYSPLRGILGAYELIYVIGTERDLIGLRTNVWQESVMLYPIRTRPERIREVFLDMMQRADKLSRHPELYDTLTNSCNSNIVRHVNTISPGRIRSGVRTALPGFADRVAHEAGLIDAELSLEEARETFRIDAIARRFPLDDNFSRAIRAQLPQRVNVSLHGAQSAPR